MASDWKKIYKGEYDINMNVIHELNNRLDQGLVVQANLDNSELFGVCVIVAEEYGDYIAVAYDDGNITKRKVYGFHTTDELFLPNYEE